MSILKEYGKFILYCDICQEPIGEFMEFYDAVEGKKDLEVVSRRISEEWCDVCNQCLR